MNRKKKRGIQSGNDIGMSLVETIVSPELGDLTQEFGEVALDSLLSDGILKDIPVIGSIVGVAKAAISVRDKLLVRKLLHFLHELRDTTEKERANFLQEFDDDPKERRKVGENLILLLDRLDNLDKPIMIAKLLKAYIKKRLSSYDRFLYFASVVDRATLFDLSALLSFYSTRHPLDYYTKEEAKLGRRFYHLGLSYIALSINSKHKSVSEDFTDRVKYKEEKEKSSTDEVIVEYKLNFHSATLAEILLGDQYLHPWLNTPPDDWETK